MHLWWSGMFISWKDSWKMLKKTACDRNLGSFYVEPNPLKTKHRKFLFLRQTLSLLWYFRNKINKQSWW